LSSLAQTSGSDNDDFHFSNVRLFSIHGWQFFHCPSPYSKRSTNNKAHKYPSFALDKTSRGSTRRARRTDLVPQHVHKRTWRQCCSLSIANCAQAWSTLRQNRNSSQEHACSEVQLCYAGYPRKTSLHRFRTPVQSRTKMHWSHVNRRQSLPTTLWIFPQTSNNLHKLDATTCTAYPDA
ncbi:hypothetical protein T4B_3429, partial [Trichinella pseudospiralis]